MNELVLRAGPGREIFHRWFVQYNPFYFASALLVLAGVFLVTRDPDRWEDGHLALAAVIQLYELALIAGAGLLFALPGQRRPAVILGIVTMAFLFDASFRTEALASIGAHTLPGAVAWVLLLGLKLAVLGRALRVRLPAGHCTTWILAGAVVALGPQLIARGIGANGVLVGACWLGIALVLLPAPKVQSELPLDEWGGLVLARLERLVPLAWAALYWAHVVGWAGIYELSFTPLCFAPLVVLLPLLMPREGLAWLAIGIALAAASQRPVEFQAVAALLALGAALKAYAAGWPRLYVAAALAALACVAPILQPFLPQSLARWGTLSLGAGFVALAAGLALNYWASRPR
jgi:hypothetical protein